MGDRGLEALRRHGFGVAWRMLGSVSGALLVRFLAAAEAGAGQRPARVWSVLTVAVVEGRIQFVPIVRNPDKLGHL